MAVCDDCKKRSTEMMIMPNEDEVCRPCLLKRLRKGKEPSNSTPRGRGRPKTYRCDSNGVGDPETASTSSGEMSAASNTEVSSSAIHHDVESAAHEFTRSARRPSVIKVYTHKEPVLVHIAETDLVKDVVMKLQEGEEDIMFNITDAQDGVRYANSFPFREILLTTFKVKSPGGTTTINPPDDEAGNQWSEAQESPENVDKQTQTSHGNHSEFVSLNTNTSDRVTDQLHHDSAPTQPGASAFQSLYQGNFNIMSGSQSQATAARSLNHSILSGFNYEPNVADNIANLQPSVVGQRLPTVADGDNRPNEQTEYQLQPNWSHNNEGYLNNSGAASSLLWQKIFSRKLPQSTFNQGSTSSTFNQAAFSNVYPSQHTDQQTDMMSSPQDLSSFRPPQVLLSANSTGVETLGLPLNPVRPDVSDNLFEPLGVPLTTPRPSRFRSPQTPIHSSRSSRSRSPPSRPADLSMPSTSRQALEASYSTIEVKGVSSSKLTHITNIPLPDGMIICFTVAFDRDGELIHGGALYDSLDLTNNKHVRCIRSVGDDILMLEEDKESDSDSVDDADEDKYTGKDSNTRKGQIGGQRCCAVCNRIHVVTYRRKSTGDRRYQPVFKVCVQSPMPCDFTVTSGRLYVTSSISNKDIQIYDYNSGKRLGVVGDLGMKWHHGICSMEDGRFFIADRSTNSVYSFHINNPTETIRKFSTEVAKPEYVTIYKNHLLVLSDATEKSIYILNMETRKKVAVLPLPECRKHSVCEISVNKLGRLAVANEEGGVHIYKLGM